MFYTAGACVANPCLLEEKLYSLEVSGVDGISLFSEMPWRIFSVKTSEIFRLVGTLTLFKTGGTFSRRGPCCKIWTWRVKQINLIIDYLKALHDPFPVEEIFRTAEKSEIEIKIHTQAFTIEAHNFYREQENIIISSLYVYIYIFN